MDDIRKLIGVGQEKDYSTDSEINSPIPPGVHSAHEVDDLLPPFAPVALKCLKGSLTYLIPVWNKGLLANQTKLMSTRHRTPLRPTIQCVFTCGRWVPRLCSPGKGKWRLPSASNADNSPR